jgi:hypothetical protein
METNFIFFTTIWFSLSLVGGVLILIRDDSAKLMNDAHFIITKGTFLHKVTYIGVALILLPFTIPKSIQHLAKNK